MAAVHVHFCSQSDGPRLFLADSTSGGHASKSPFSTWSFAAVARSNALPFSTVIGSCFLEEFNSAHIKHPDNNPVDILEPHVHLPLEIGVCVCVCVCVCVGVCVCV